MRKVFKARYRSACTLCDVPVEAGDVVSYDEDAMVAHAGCVTAALPLSGHEHEICGECHMQKPCDCDEVVAA